MERSTSFRLRDLTRALALSTLACWPFFLVLLDRGILVDYWSSDRVLLALLGVSSTSLLFALLPWRPALVALWPWMVLAPLEALHIHLYRSSTSLGVLGAVVDTNPAEATEFLANTWGWVAACVVSAVGWPLLCVRRFRPSRRLGWGIRTSLVAVWALLLFVHWERQVRRHGDPVRQVLRMEEVVDQSWPAGGAWKLWAIGREKVRARLYARRMADDAWKAVAVDAPSDETVVLVMGESSRADRWSACGFPRPTTPLVAADTSLAVFCDVASGANITNAAVSSWLTPAPPEDPDRFHRESPVLKAFREVGFRVWWISTQGRFGLNDSRVSLIASQADTQIFLPREAEAYGHYDQDLLPVLERALASGAGRRLVVLHTLGSHLRYDYRYPRAFDRFQPSLLSTRGWDHTRPSWAPVFINSYDNSLAYTDWLLEQVLGRLRSRPGRNALVYVSDHGEQLWEDASCPLGHGSPVPVRSEFRVPMLFWASDSLRRLRPDLWDWMRRHRQEPVGSGDLIPTLLDLAGIGSPRLDSTRSLAREAWRPHPRMGRTTSGRLVDVDTLAAPRRSVSDPGLR